MTQRERQTPDPALAHEAIRTPAVGSSGAAFASGSASPASEASLWDEWCQRASPAQQQEAVQRAMRETVLFAHQLAVPAHSAASNRSLLASLFNGQVKELEPLHPPDLRCRDADLDDRQREAAAAALATPDTCLIQGFPGTGKSRVLAEIILQAAQRGQRILFLAPTTTALDRVLERIGAHTDLCPIRCLEPDEKIASLPQAIARLTLPERLRSHRETTIPAARAAREAARQLLDRRCEEQPRWARLLELAAQAEPVAERLRALSERTANLAAEVECEDLCAPAYRARLESLKQTRASATERLDGQLAVLQAELETILGKRTHIENEWERIRPLAEARRTCRFWSATWWRAALRSGLNEQIRDLETRRSDLDSTRQCLDRDIATLRDDLAAIAAHYTADRKRLQDEEIARRRAEIDGETAVVRKQLDALRQQWHTLTATLVDGEIPSEMSRSAATEAHVAWERQRALCERNATTTEQWFQVVEDGARNLPEKLVRSANVVAATTTALAGDAHFGERKGAAVVLFDLLILEDSHQVTETEFAAAARRAGRWVLFGEPQLDLEPGAAARKAIRPAVLRPGFFERLWRNMHADPRQLPHIWMRREGRLVCRLRPFAADQEKWIETESVVDRSDIELRILSAPRHPPRVVEVLFPADADFGEAKQFLYHELDELAIQTRGRCLNWRETDAEIVLQLAPCVDTETQLIPLDHGLMEKIAHRTDGDEANKSEIGWHTCSLHFGREAGWTRSRAETWFAERCGLRSLGRTYLLTTPYRFDPPLARFLSNLLFDGLCHPTTTTCDPSRRSPVEFVAVPTLDVAESETRWNGGEPARGFGERGASVLSARPRRLHSLKGGAGLELDLADNRPLEQLPAHLRSSLPRQGLVNYLEALALVKRLESLIHDSAFRVDCERWRDRRLWPCEHGNASPTLCGCIPPSNGPLVAVMALYPAQVEMLAQLIRQTPSLNAAPFPIEIGLPTAFSHRECLLALVSLTRSHTHRAVSYGEHPNAFARSLTRAASRLILFGDPGTLARRGQWHGSLDHLDDGSAEREAVVIRQLVHYLQGNGPHPLSFHVQEGSGV